MKMKIGIYCYFIADILTKKYFRAVCWVVLYHIYSFCPNLSIWLAVMATKMLNLQKIFKNHLLRFSCWNFAKMFITLTSTVDGWVGRWCWVASSARASYYFAYGRAEASSACSRCGTGGLFFFLLFFLLSNLSSLPFLMPHNFGDGWTYWNVVVSTVMTQTGSCQLLMESCSHSKSKPAQEQC